MEAIPLAIGVGSALLGGGGQKQKQQSQSTQFQQGENFSNQLGLQSAVSGPVNVTTPWFQQLGQQTAGGLGQFMQSGPQTGYTGPFTSDLLNPVQTALGGAQAGAFDPTRLSSINQFITGANINPYVQQAVNAAVQPLMMAQNQELGRRIPGAFAAAGQTLGPGGSSPYQRALGEAAYTSQRAIGDTASQVANQAFQQAQQAQLQSIQLGQQDVQNMLANVQAQWLPQAIQEKGIDRAIASGQQGIQNLLSSFQIAQGLPLQNVQQASSSLGLNTGNAYGYNTGQSQSTSSGTSTTTPSLVSGLFGNQGAFPALFGSFGSQLGRT